VAVGTRAFKTKIGGATTEGIQAEITITDYREIIRDLRKLEGEMLKQFKAGARDIAKPVQAGIKREIPLKAPLRGSRKRKNGMRYGMQPVRDGAVGRLTWGQGKPARSAVIREQSPKKFPQNRNVSIVKIVVGSPATILADMAGKSNSYTGRKRITDPYPYKFRNGEIGVRRHKIRGQGVAMIRALDRSPSRYAYRGAEDAMPQAVANMQDHLNDAIRVIQRELNKNNGSE